MRIVYDAANLIDAHLVRHALEWADIPTFVRGEALLGGIGERPAFGLVSVAVPDSVFDQALEVVSQLGLGSGRAEQDDAIKGQGGECLA